MTVTIGISSVERRRGLLTALFCVAGLLADSAAAQTISDSAPPASRKLPEYALGIDLQTQTGRVTVDQRVTWTNPGTAATDKLVFQVVPNHRPSAQELNVGDRTVESLRLDPRDSIDRRGRRFHLTAATIGSQPLTCTFDTEHDTHLHVRLPRPVAPGESVEIRLRYLIDLPQVMGRLGQHKGVTNLLNWYPVLAVYEGDRWQPVPYIAWHQPWYNEAGNYRVRLRLPADQKVVTGGRVVSQTVDRSGQRVLEIEGEGLRDFTIVASSLFREWRSEANGVPIRVTALPGHEDAAEVAVRTAEDCIRTYSEWFGPYPYREFELTESYFGWNGNESSGVVMIDERIFAMPAYGHRYVEHLICHEMCHQWWYSAVGTDGYHEPWMDEGLVQWFSRVKMEDKYGPDPSLLQLPAFGVLKFPNVQYRSLLHSGYQTFHDRGGSGAALASLDEIGHLHNLFSLVYDRGAQITGMIQHRMGRENFFAFMKQLYAKYRFGILKAADFQRELEDFTGEDWQPFFDQWLHSGHESDWKLEHVDVTETENGYRTRARIVQRADIPEPVEIGVSVPGSARPYRIATIGEAQQLMQRSRNLSTEADSTGIAATPISAGKELSDSEAASSGSETQPGVANSGGDGITVERQSDNDWLVTIVSDERPAQIEIDPDGTVLDANRSNNCWKPSYNFRVTPFYTPADEAPLLQPHNQHSIVTGFGVDSDGRIGFRSSLLHSNRYRISPFVSYTAATASNNDDHISAGVDAVFYNVPSSNWQLLARYEHALLSTLSNDPGHQARFALRRVLKYTTSLIYPNASYIDFYTRLGDNFFPDRNTAISADPRVQNYDNVRAFGVAYHLDSQMPYWDPDQGFRFDAGYEHGFTAFDDGAAYDRVTGQFGVVQRLSEAPWWLSETKLAARVSSGYGWNDNGRHFRFGGPGRFRGIAANDLIGNAFWVSTLEWRFPLSGELDYEAVDNTAGLHSIDGALFYDVGRSYLFNSPQGDIDHAVGGGLYFQIPLLSFVENLTVRTEYGYSLVNETSAAWFGLYRAF
ncbi:MAG: M1 family aminopeptidase [Planctomycetaceae bacterium]